MKQVLNLFLRIVVALYVLAKRHPIERIADNHELRASPKSILVFSNTALGDTILSTPAIASLRHSFPNAIITFFVNQNIAPLFADFEYVDAIVPYQGGFKRFWRTVGHLRGSRPDIALLLHSNAPQDIPMAVLSGANIILKPPTKSEYRKYLSFEFSPKLQHAIEERLDLVRKIGASTITTRMALPARYHSQTPGPLKSQLDWAGSTIIGFQVGAANTFKMWPDESFSALADRLSKSVDRVRVVITGSQKERKLGDQIVNGCSTKNVHNFCGKVTIEALPYLVRDFDLLVSNDTGTMHLAIALGVPTVCLFGATSSQAIGPYQDLDKHVVIQKHSDNPLSRPKKKRDNSAMRQITVDEVQQAVSAILNHRSST